MTDDGQEVVIVDGAGTEHIFPAGFDPKKAAGIVRGASGATQPPAFGTAPSAEDMLSRRVGADTITQMEGKTDWKTPLIETMQQAAHPQTVSDVSRYFISSATPQIVGRIIAPIAGRVSKYGGAVLDAGTSLLPRPARAALDVLRELNPSEWNSPLTVAGREGRAVAASRAFNDLPLQQQMEHLPATPAPLPPTEMAVRPGAGKMADVRMLRGRVVEPPPRNLGSETQVTAAPLTAATPQPAPSTLSTVDRAALLKQGYPPELIARIEQRLAQDSGLAPMASHPVSPLREPRVQVGAEQVGRQAGMTKEAVREVTGPVLDEAVGEASPIFPKNTLTKIVDDMRALPPGAEREAYVARATSGKAKWQVENIRRTLEHLGLLVPLASSDVRAAVMQRLMPSHATSGEGQ